jgi:hypothetical protein
MAARTITLDTFRTHLNDAKDRLSREKLNILQLYPLADDFGREEYAFAYVRAERLGMQTINAKLAEIAWLPMQLDARAEIMAEDRASMKRWLVAALAGKPDSGIFGNDFVHALARCGLKHGWEDGETLRLSLRVANLFRELSCLIGLIYYSTWLDENGVEELRVTDPDNLGSTAEEVASLIQSPELYRLLRAKEQDVDKVKNRKSLAKPEKKSRPILSVITNDSYLDPFMPDPALV